MTRGMAGREHIKKLLPDPVLSALGKALGADRKGYHRISRLGADSGNPWIRKSAEIDGWLFEGEHDLLWELATDQDHGDIVEIGAWMGKSSCIFAGACADHAPGTRLFSVDPFTMLGSVEQERYHRRLMGKSTGTFFQFKANAQHHGFADYVIPLATTSEVAMHAIADGSCRLAFVDARHDYQGVSTDTRLVLPKLMPGGLPALHDAGVYDDVDRHIEQDLKADVSLKFEKQVNSIAVFRKSANAAGASA